LIRQLIGWYSALCFANVPHRLDYLNDSLKRVNINGHS
jgi:hypothetical protein